MRSEHEYHRRRRSRASQSAHVLFASAFACDFYAIVPTQRPIPSFAIGYWALLDRSFVY